MKIEFWFWIVITASLLVTNHASAINTDSLKQAIADEYNDSLRMELLNEFSFQIRRIDFDTSYVYAKKAQELAEKLGNSSGQAKALKNIGTVLWSKGNYIKAKETYLKSLVLYEKSKDTNGMSRLWNNLGLISLTQNDFTEAKEHFEKSYEYSKIVNDQFMLSTSSLNIGFSCFYLKEYAEAISYHHRSLDYANKNEDSLNMANNYVYLGAEYTFLQQYEQALKYLKRSLEIFKKLNYQRDIAHNHNLLADYFISVKDYKNAVLHSDTALSISESMNSLVNQYDANTNLSEAWFALRNYQKAYRYLNQAFAQNKELIDKENKQNIANLTAEYNYQKKLDRFEAEKQVESERQEKNINNRNMVIIIISIIVFFLIIFAVFLYKSNLNKKKQNLLLIEQKTSIDEKNKQLEQMNLELQELNNTKDKFFSIIAHDLNNPIYSLNSLAQILDEEYDTISEEEKREFVGLMRKSSSHVYSLLENLLTWSRSQRGKIQYNPSEGHLSLILNSTIEGVEVSASQKDINIEVDLSDEYTVFTDYNLINTIARNILTNAVKFTTKGGYIKISSRRSGEIVELSIKDSGVGMSEEVMETLFLTGDNKSTLGTENEKGTGLGLIICKEFALKNGGDIRVQSEEDEGSEFIVSIPTKEK